MASSNHCSVCPKGAGTCFCPGCQAYFCDKDFINHRRMLVNGLDELTVDRNELQEKINRMRSNETAGSSALLKADTWQKITIEFEELSQEIEQLRETEGVLEQDLSRLKQLINKLNENLEKLLQSLPTELDMTQDEEIEPLPTINVEEKLGTTKKKHHQVE